MSDHQSSSSNVQQQIDGAMVASQHLWAHETINNRRVQSIGCDEIVKTPANILAAVVVSVRPKCVRLLNARV